MTKTMLMATAAMLCLASAAHAGDADKATTAPTGPTATQEAAQNPVPTGPTDKAPLDDASQRGVLVFQPEFFAAQRPNTAQDMVNRVPGFIINDGAGTRGFEGAVGNILINGDRPASKNDTSSNVLGRIPANRVERIELIRGGAPGVDMQGYSVIVNVILKKGVSRQSILTWNAMLFDGGHDIYGGSYQFTSTQGERTWSVVLSDGTGTSDSNGAGRSIVRDADGTVLSDQAYLNDGWGGGNGQQGVQPQVGLVAQTLWVDSGQGLTATPRWSGGKAATVELEAESPAQPGRPFTQDAQGAPPARLVAQTTLNVPLGEWVPVAQTNRQEEVQRRGMLSTQSVSADEQAVLEIRVSLP